MKLYDEAQAPSVIKSHGVESTSSFGFHDSPHLFLVLSDGLYADKVSSVLREIGCNAMDAHIAAGKPDLPFEVKLPSAFERTFYIKDFGVGLDEEEIRRIYVQYGKSTKQQSEEETGCFGLGSKSPFAYTLKTRETATDGFTVEAVKAGIKRIFVCHLDDIGSPAVSKIYEGPASSDWTSGVKVSFAVQAEDISEFHRKAQDVFSWFKVRPNIIGAPVKLNANEYELQGSFFKYTGGELSSSVVMANVRYPLENELLADNTPTHLREMVRAGIVLFVPNGTVLMAPSRERLQQTERTKKGIREWLEKAYEATGTVLLNKLRTVFEAEQSLDAYRKAYKTLKVLPSQWGISMLSEMLQKAGASPEEASKLLAARSAAVVALPANIGEEPHVTFQKRFASYNEMSEDPVSMQTFLRLRGEPKKVLAYYVSKEAGARRRSAEKVVAREIVNGFIGASRASHNCERALDVYYSDSKSAMTRVKAAVKCGKVGTALVFVATCGNYFNEAQAAAENAITQQPLTGITAQGTSTLPALNRPKVARTSAPRAAKVPGDKSAVKRDRSLVPVLPLAATVVSSANTIEMELDSVPENCKYYAVFTPSEVLRFIKPQDTLKDSIRATAGYSNESLLSAINVVVERSGAPIKGFVLLSRADELKKLNLQEKGFKPILTGVAESMKTYIAAKKMQEGSFCPKFISLESWRESFSEFRDMGLLGLLAFSKKNQSALWDAFQNESWAAPLCENASEVLNAVARYRKEFSNSEEQTFFNSVRTLQSMLTSIPEDWPSNASEVLPMLPRNVDDRFRQVYPAVQFINTEKGSLLVSLSQSKEQDLDDEERAGLRAFVSLVQVLFEKVDLPKAAESSERCELFEACM